MALTIFQIDAFTAKPFAGNPAAVLLLPEPRDEAWMQALAREMNLSETAFLVRNGDGFDLRWFTPTVEVALCGHATLASAHFLWEQGHLPPDAQARFQTKSGLLTADRLDDGWIQLDFPAEQIKPAEPPPDILRALDVRPVFFGKNRLDAFIEVESEILVRQVAPDFSLLKKAGGRGVIVTSWSSMPDFDYVCRFFGPAAGVDEDPVTGSAQCALGPYWAAKLGKEELLGYQASARGGVVRVRPHGDRVLISGQAVTVFRAELLA